MGCDWLVTVEASDKPGGRWKLIAMDQRHNEESPLFSPAVPADDIKRFAQASLGVIIQSSVMGRSFHKVEQAIDELAEEIGWDPPLRERRPRNNESRT